MNKEKTKAYFHRINQHLELFNRTNSEKDVAEWEYSFVNSDKSQEEFSANKENLYEQCIVNPTQEQFEVRRTPVFFSFFLFIIIDYSSI